MINKKEIISHTFPSVVPQISAEQRTAFLSLFKMAPICPLLVNKTSVDALKRGLIFINSEGDILDKISDVNFQAAAAVYDSLEGSFFNQTFYKSFGTVAEADALQLILDKAAHYLTAYTVEAFGLQIPAYVPIQDLKVPEWRGSAKRLTVIQLTTYTSCIEKLNNYLLNTVAPNPNSIFHLSQLLPLTTLSTNQIKSFELQVLHHKFLDTFPKDPVTQLRYLVYLATKSTLLIKNASLYTAIKESSLTNTTTICSALSQMGTPTLASIFFRFKPIFLAFKAHKNCAPLINNLRRQAARYHRPLGNECLQNLTSIKDAKARKDIIAKASNRELIKVINSIGFKCHNHYSTMPNVYTIRNGLVFVLDKPRIYNIRHLEALGDYLFDTLIERLKPQLQGRTFYIPNYIDYAAPTTEKQFIGNIPYGSVINCPMDKAFTAGIHWFNQDNNRVDIDLHLNSPTQAFGWNADYRQDTSIIYTGDNVDAPKPKGAAEAFYFKPSVDESYILQANLFSGPNNVPFNFFMTETKPILNRNYTADPNDLLFPPIPLNFINNNLTQTLGLFTHNRFYFYGGNLSNSIVPNGHYAPFIKGIDAQLHTKLSLSTIIETAGGVVARDLSQLSEKGLEEVISLAPEDLTATTLLDILDSGRRAKPEW